MQDKGMIRKYLFGQRPKKMRMLLNPKLEIIGTGNSYGAFKVTIRLGKERKSVGQFFMSKIGNSAKRQKNQCLLLEI